MMWMLKGKGLHAKESREPPDTLGRGKGKEKGRKPVKHSYVCRILSALLAFVLLFELLPTGALAANPEGTGVPQVEAAAVQPGEASQTVVGEVESYREERVKHFRMEDGSFIAVDYGIPVHYALDEDTWADIDNTLIPESTAARAAHAPGRAGQYTAVNGETSKTFSGNLAAGFLFSA